MSNLGFAETSYRTKSLASLSKGSINTLSSAPTNKPAFWENALYILGKPEEYVVKALATPFTDDPALQFGGGHDLYDQANFSMLFRKAGANEAGALGAGLAASVLLDPLNFIGVGALTKAGKVGKLVKAARALDALEVLDDGTKLFSKSKLAEKLAELEKITGAGAKRASKAAKDIKKQLSSIDVLNQEFAKLQKTKSLDEIMLADSVVGQIANKQRTVLSVGTGHHILARPMSRSPALSETADFGIKGKSAAKLVEYPFLAGKGIKDQASKVLNKFGAHIPVTEAQKNLKQVMTKMMQNIGGDTKEFQDEVLNVMARAHQEGVTREDMMDIIRTIEGPDDIIKRAATDILARSDAEDLLRTAVPEGANAVRPRSSVDLTKRQQGLLNPVLVSEDEAIDAVNNAVKGGEGTTQTASGHDVFIDKNNVVVKLNKTINKKLLTQNLDVPGITPWKVVDTEDGRFLVGQWHGGTLSMNKAKWTREHLDNLEKTAAMLAQKGYKLGPMTPADVLVGSAGEVQIINPETISKVAKPRNKNLKRIDVALEESRRSIADLVANVGDLPRSNFEILGDTKAAKKIDKSAFKFSADSPDAERLVGSDTVYYSNVGDLIESGNNTDWIKNLDEDTIKAMGIDKEIQKLEDTGTARPIQVTVDDRGNLEIKEGGSRLAAALIAGFEDVPVERVPYTGEIAADLADQRVVTGPTRNADNIIEDLPQSVRFLPGNLDDFTVQDVRYLGPKGVVRVGGAGVERLSQSPLLSDFEVWYTRQAAVRDLRISTARADTLVTNQQSILSSGLARAVGPAGQSNEKTLLLADILNQTSTPEEFFRVFRERTGVDITYGGLNRADRALLNRGFAELKRESDTLLRDLAKDGLLVPSTRTPEHIGIASRNLGLTAHYAEGKDLVFLNDGVTNQELMQFAKTHAQAHAADLGKDANVIVKSLDDVKTIKGTDIVGDAHPFTDRILPANSRFYIEDVDKQRLAENGAGLWNDPKLHEILGEGSGEIIKNKGQTFFVSRSGALVIGKQTNVEDLLYLTFGEGAKQAQEIGAVTKDTIYLSNVFGSSFSNFTAKEMQPFIKRLKEVAHKFEEAGFDSRFRVNVEFPFDDEITRQVMKKDMTLGDLINDRDVVRIPDSLEGIATKPVGLPSVVVGVDEKINRITAPKVKELFKWVTDKFDEIAIKELEAGLPLSYTTNYYARFLSPQLQSGLDNLMTKFMEKKGLLNWYNKNHLQRRFTDLRTDEVNDLFRDMQKEFKLTGSDVVEFGKANDSAFMRQLAADNPEAFEFFTTDPFRSVMARAQVGLKSVNTVEANKAIIDPANGIVVASITKGEMRDLQTFTKRAAKIGEDLNDLKNEREILRGRLEGATSPEEVARINKNLEGVQKDINNRASELAKMSENPTINPGYSEADLVATVGAGDKAVVMSNIDAKQLVRDGLISEDTILSSTAAPMVKVNLDAVPDGAKIHFMDAEVADNLVTRFGSLSADPKPVLNAYDKVLNIWKNWTLFPIPKYHIRNFFSNFLLGWLGRIEIKSYDQAGEIQRLIGKYTSGAISKDDLVKTLKGIQIPSDLGTVTNGHELYSAWIHEGGVTGGLHVNELGMNNIVTRKSVSLGFSPATELVNNGVLLDNSLIRGGRKTAEVIENYSRFAAFIDGWTKSGSFAEAGLNMKKIFYNYNDLNAFEKNVLRRVIPFYSWSRHNIPRMLETVVTQPILHYRLAQFVRNVEQGAGGPTDPNEIPAWLSERFHVNIGRNGKGQLQLFVGDGVIPMVDAYRVVSSLEGGVDMLKEGLTPFLKVPVEQLINKSFFTMKEIEKAPGEPARSFTLQSLGFTRRATAEGALGLANIVLNESLVKNMRVFSMAAQFMDDVIYGEGNIRNEDPTFAASAIDMLLGRVYGVDTERAIRWDNMRRDKEVARAKAFIKEGQEKNRPALIQFGRSRLLQLEVVRDD